MAGHGGHCGGRKAFITGLGGATLTGEEALFLAASRPAGIILFTRNFVDNAQLAQLIDEARRAIGGGDLLVLIDQEGGRVQRLRGAAWPDLPPAAAFGTLYTHDAEAGCRAARIVSQALSVKLRDVGINANCVPCLDVPVAGADGVIGNRAYAEDAEVVIALGGAVASGAIAGGVVPIMKHIPGHGRAGVDSHLALPVVATPRPELAAQDFAPFRALAHLPAAMTAHVTFTALDGAHPASVSAIVTQEIIRDGIGFDGLLMSDDVSMQALAGSIAERARAVITAGSDIILHCNGVLDEMGDVAAAAPVLAGRALQRFERCIEVASRCPEPVADAAFVAELQRVHRVAGRAQASVQATASSTARPTGQAPS